MVPDKVGIAVLAPLENKLVALSMENVTGTVTAFLPTIRADNTVVVGGQ